MILGVLKHALMITRFVLIMMLLIEYINVQTRGSWQQALRKGQSGQILLGAVLGATPGCIGAFTVVSLYSHRSLSFGALVAAMIATSGGFLFLLVTGLLGGPVWDWKKISFALGSAFALFVVLSVPDHFLEQHLREHVLKRHLLRVFFWTFGVLLAIYYPTSKLHRAGWSRNASPASCNPTCFFLVETGEYRIRLPSWLHRLVCARLVENRRQRSNPFFFSQVS